VCRGLRKHDHHQHEVMSCIVCQLHVNRGKTKYMIVERKNSSKQKKIGQLTIKNCTFERFESLKYLGVTQNEDNNHQIDLQERIKNANKTYFMLQKFFRNNISSSSSSCSGRIRFDSCSLYTQNEIGPSISSLVVLCVFVLFVYIVVLV